MLSFFDMHKFSTLYNNKYILFCGVRKILKTFITRMPDKAGAFLKACNIIVEMGGAIKRVSYNKGIDAHTLFIDVYSDEEKIDEIAKKLYESGYLNASSAPKTMLLMLKMREETKELTKPFEIFDKYKVNISYISAREGKSDVFDLKVGVLIENVGETVSFLNELSSVCDIKVLKNDVTEKNLDNTVFYIGFAHEMRKILELCQNEANEIIVNSNKIMQRLEEDGENPLKTFECIKKFAEFVSFHKGKNFGAKVYSKDVGDFKLHLIEPPCGGNTCIIEGAGEILFVDCGFACFENEMLEIFKGLLNNFEKSRKYLFLTHCDMDHAGLWHLFEKVYVSQKTYVNFMLEEKGEKNYRQRCEHHEAYGNLTKIISGYKTPDLGKLIVVSEGNGENIEKSGTLDFCGENFEIYEGNGGHVPGESMLVWENEKIVFSGDIYVNAAGYSEEQAKFNEFAPYLTKSVNVDSKKALVCRNEFMNMFKEYLICPGHGKWCNI